MQFEAIHYLQSMSDCKPMYSFSSFECICVLLFAGMLFMVVPTTVAVADFRLHMHSCVKHCMKIICCMVYAHTAADMDELLCAID